MTQPDIRDEKLRQILTQLVVPEIGYASAEKQAPDLINELSGELLSGKNCEQYRSVTQALKQLTFGQHLPQYYANAAFLTDRTFDIWQRKNTLADNALRTLNRWRFLALALLWQDEYAPYTHLEPLIDLVDESYRCALLGSDEYDSLWQSYIEDIESMLFSRLLLEEGYLPAVQQQWSDFERQLFEPRDQSAQRIRLGEVYVAAAGGLQKIVDAQEGQRLAAAQKAEKEAQALRAQEEARIQAEQEAIALEREKEEKAKAAAEAKVKEAEKQAQEQEEARARVAAQARAAAPIDKPSDVRIQSTISRLEDDPSQQADELDIQQPEFELARHVVDELQLHAWVSVTEKDEPQRYKLIVLLKNSGKYIFVDRFGIKKKEFKYHELVIAVARENVKPLSDGARIDENLERAASRLRMKGQ